jgi:hypothetical protein
MNTRIMDLIGRISANWMSSCDSTVVFDLARWVRHLTMDTITHLSFGKPLGYVEHDRDVMEFSAVMERNLPFVLHLSVFTELNRILDLLGSVDCLKRILYPHFKDATGLGRVRAVSFCYAEP